MARWNDFENHEIVHTEQLEINRSRYSIVLNFDKTFWYGWQGSTFYDKIGEAIEMIPLYINGRHASEEWEEVRLYIIEKFGSHSNNTNGCTCGAQKTNNPNLHSHWCDSLMR